MLSKRIELDLVLINGLTLVLVLVILTSSLSWLRIILGFPFVTFFPGYVFILILFPRKEDLNTMTRLILSLGLSIAIVIFIGLILNFTPPGITLYSLLFSIAFFTFFASGLAWYIRQRTRLEERFSLNLRPFLVSLSHSLKAGGKGYLSLIIILVCALLGGSGVLGYTMTKSIPKQTFTEFYILGTAGQAANYPLELNPGEEGQVVVGIVSHQPVEVDYRLEVLVAGDKLYELYPITLEPEEKWERTVGFTIQERASRQKVEFRLYPDSQPAGEIRYLWVNIKA